MNECPHKKTTFTYGFARTSGWKGLGTVESCLKCYKVLSFAEDECCTDEERKFNDKKRKREIKRTVNDWDMKDEN